MPDFSIYVIPRCKKKNYRNLHSLRCSDCNVSMNHALTKTERDCGKHLVKKARETSKQEHVGCGLTKYEVLHGRKYV